MATDEALRQQVLDHFRQATDRRYEECIKDFPPEAMNVRPPNVDYTPWHLLEHLRVGLSDILDYVRNPRYVGRNWPDDYWPAKDAQADAAAWAKTADAYRTDREALAAIIADPGQDLLLPLPHTAGHTILREVFLVAGHTSYHLGEFGILREVMQTWRRER